MTPPPDTRASLIQRLPNADDVEAWDTFLDIYEPLLFRLAHGRGMQPADAEDFVQEVLLAVAGSVERWVARERRGPFRAWLFRIASNLSVNFLTRPRHRRIGSGDSRMQQFLEQQYDPCSDPAERFALEYRRELFRWAAEVVRERVSERVWLAFWLTTVGEQSIADVAAQLGVSVGAVYISRSRITSQITDLIKKHEAQTQ